MEPKLKWTTQKRKVRDLLPYEKNPRQMTASQAKQLTKSLQKFNLVEIPAIDTDNRIIAGHMRLKIMMQLGRGDEEIDVRVPNRKLTKEEFKEYNIRSNKNTGEGDFDALANNFEIQDLKEWGFKEDELKFDFVKEDDVPEVSEGEPISKLGDIYQLGNHRVMCGDSTKIEDVEKLMDGQKAEVTITDPPYNYGIEYDSYDDKRKEEEYEKFVISYYQIAKLFSKKIIVSVGIKNLGIYYKNFNPTWLIIWVKKNCRTRSKLRHYSSWEPWIIEEFEEQQNWDIIWVEGKATRPCKDFLEYNIVIQKELEGKHPVPKPLKLIQELITKFSDREQIILDLFGGSGSTLIACEQMHRRCYMMEIDNRYTDVIIKRWQALSRNEAIRLSDGKKWNELNQEN